MTIDNFVSIKIFVDTLEYRIDYFHLKLVLKSNPYRLEYDELNPPRSMKIVLDE